RPGPGRPERPARRRGRPARRRPGDQAARAHAGQPRHRLRPAAGGPPPRGARSPPPPPAAAQPAADQATKPPAPTPASRATASGQRQQGSGSGQEQSSHPSGSPPPEGVTTLTDGRYDAYVRKVDPDRDLIVVDLVQVFTGKAAVRAAIEDGMDRSAAEVRDTYVRNQNPRLRTLEMAGGVRLNLIGSCESTGQEALFTHLIKDTTSGQGP